MLKAMAIQLDSACIALRIAMQNDSAIARYEASRVPTHPAWKETTRRVYNKGVKSCHQ